MSQPFEAIHVTDRVYWVGAIDWAIRDFHGYSTDRGTTYNAYLILADKITLVDTVKAPFIEQLMSRIRSVVDPRDIDIIISNHSEMDHSGSLPTVIDAVKPSRIVASKMGVKALAQHFGRSDVDEVSDGESLSLGDANVTFYETRMLHWPDSMFTYLHEDELLFSQDAFGMHLASCEMLTDELDKSVLDWEAAKYYANILMPYSPIVTKLLDRLDELALPLKVVAPDHGPMWRSDIDRIIEKYRVWAEMRPNLKVVIVYDTMWGSTAMMAHSIADGVRSAGGCPRVLPLGSADRSQVAAEVLEAGALLVGTPTINNQMFPRLADTLSYLKGLKPRNLIGTAFGSHGWSGEGALHVHEILGDMGVELLTDAKGILTSQYVPDDDALRRCHELGEDVARRLGAGA
ncbi:MAG: flavodoxin domain-containing protein [Candidatus Eisenbacteria bacterium]